MLMLSIVDKMSLPRCVILYPWSLFIVKKSYLQSQNIFYSRNHMSNGRKTGHSFFQICAFKIYMGYGHRGWKRSKVMEEEDN